MMGWVCALCGKIKPECEKNIFCQRTILSNRKSIKITSEDGEETTYYSFSEATGAMKEYGEMMLLKDKTFHKEVLIEKTNNNEKNLESNIRLGR